MRPHVVAWVDGLLGAGLGELFVPNYIVMLSAAMVLGAVLVVHVGRAHGFDMRRGLLALAIGYVGTRVGARLFTVFANVPEAIVAGDAALLWRGGLAAYGGFIGGVFAFWLGLGRRDFLPFCDIMAAGLGLGTAVTRLGCFLGGCDYGTVTAVAWGVRFPPGSPAFGAHAAAGWVGPFSASSLAVHPTELYEAALGLVICIGAMLWMRRRRGRRRDGRVFLSTVAVYAVARYAIEIFRGDVDRGVFFGAWSASQLASIAVLAVVVMVALRRWGVSSLLRPTAAAAGVLVAICAFPASAKAAGPTVAVVDVVPSGAPGVSVRRGLAAVVAEKIKGAEWIAPARTRSELEARGVTPEEVTDPAAWALVARMLEADIAVGISVEIEGEGAGFLASGYDDSGAALWTLAEPCPGCSPAQLERAAHHLGSRLTDAIAGRMPALPAGLSGADSTPVSPRTKDPFGDGGDDDDGEPAVVRADPVDVADKPETTPGKPGDTRVDEGKGGDVTGPAVAGAVSDTVTFMEKHPVAIRLGAGPTFVVWRRTVPTLGFQTVLEGSYTLPGRTELGLQVVYFLNPDATHVSASVAVEWKIGPAKRNAPYAGGSIGWTAIIFDEAANTIHAFDTRVRLGWEFLFGKTFGLRLELLNFSFLISEAFGIIPSFEPRIVLGFRI